MSNEQSESSPLNEFSGCHDGIISNFHRLQDLVERYRHGEEPRQLRKTARQLLDFFEDVVRDHHAEEEEELFVAVLQNLEGEDEDTARRARELVRQLTVEHRQLEALWEGIEKGLRRLARGKPGEFDDTAAALLAERYLSHAEFEEREFLPLAARILDKQAMSELGLSLHLRHMERVNAYI